MKEEPAIFYGMAEEEEECEDQKPKTTPADVFNARYPGNSIHDRWQRRVWVCLV